MARFLNIARFSAALITILGSSTAMATVVDLTRPGASASINGAVFEQATTPSGRPIGFQPFPPAGNRTTGTSPGISPHARRVENDRLQSVPLSAIGVINVDGVDYRRLRLDFRRAAAASPTPLALTGLTLYVADKPNLADAGSLGTPAYDLNAGAGGHSVRLGNAQDHREGNGEMVALIPNAAFVNRSGKFLYLRSRFDAPAGASWRWSFTPSAVAAVPEPSSVVITLLGLGCIGGLRLRRAIRNRLDSELSEVLPGD